MRRLIIALILLTIILTACQSSVPAVTEVPTEAEIIENTQAPTDTAVHTEEAQETAASTEQVEVSDAPPPGCTVISPQPTPGPTERSLFPPAGEDDWIVGPDDAAITITEYGDFQ